MFQENLWKVHSEQYFRFSNVFKNNKRRSRTAIFSINVARRKWWNIRPNKFTDNPLLTKVFWMETFSDELEPIATEIYEFESRQNKITNRMFSFWTIQSEYKIRDCFILEIFKNLSASTQTLIEEFKSVAFEKHELEKQDISWLIVILPLLVNQDSESDVMDRFHDS